MLEACVALLPALALVALGLSTLAGRHSPDAFGPRALALFSAGWVCAALFGVLILHWMGALT